MSGRLRTGVTGGIALAAGALLVIAAAQGNRAAGRAPIQNPKSKIQNRPASYASSVRPFVAKYCLACHSTKIKAGHLDLQRFTGAAQVGRDPKPWQGVIEHLDVGDMPPRGSLQPSPEEKRRVTAWTRDFLVGLARAESGDPGSVPLRRLSNTEYDATIRDLTGVDLRPAREFPADGAAGEGFTNAAEALTDISPALFTKYMTAAKEVSEHGTFIAFGRTLTGAEIDKLFV